MIANLSFESRKLLGFYAAEVSLPSEDLVSPRSGLADKEPARRRCNETVICDESSATLNADGEALEEEMECELRSEYIVKAAVDFMSGCGCGRGALQSAGEAAIVALHEAVKNARQSDTIHRNPPKGDSQSNESAENAVREAEGMIRT